LPFVFAKSGDALLDEPLGLVKKVTGIVDA
jgi:hypothetical protein